MKRKTLPGQIREASSTSEQLRLAAIGHQVSRLEATVRTYLAAPSDPLVANASQEFRDELQSLITEALRDQFCEVLETRDSAALRSIADLLDAPQTEAADPVRSAILMLKAAGQRLTLNQLQRALKYKGNLDALRHTAASVGYELALDKVGRPQKTPVPKHKKRASES